jgi:hypothetical protein
MLMATPATSTPSAAACAANDATFALWMMCLLGRHATLGQEPPIILRSITAVRCPSLERVKGRYFPASPLPMTRTS